MGWSRPLLANSKPVLGAAGGGRIFGHSFEAVAGTVREFSDFRVQHMAGKESEHRIWVIRLVVFLKSCPIS